MAQKRIKFTDLERRRGQRWSGSLPSSEADILSSERSSSSSRFQNSVSRPTDGRSVELREAPRMGAGIYYDQGARAFNCIFFQKKWSIKSGNDSLYLFMKTGASPRLWRLLEKCPSFRRDSATPRGSLHASHVLWQSDPGAWVRW